jgi:hypothetical protein
VIGLLGCETPSGHSGASVKPQSGVASSQTATVRSTRTDETTQRTTTANETVNHATTSGASASVPHVTAGSTAPAASTTNPTYAVIIKAAGYVDKSGPDTLSSATSEPYNTHVFADVLAQHLRELNVNTEIRSWIDCPKLSCIRRPDSTSTASIVVFAGMTQNHDLPRELKAFVPELARITPPPKVTSALTSCQRNPGVVAFVAQLAAAKLNTVSGAAPQGEYVNGSLTDGQMHASLGAFARRLVDAL